MTKSDFIIKSEVSLINEALVFLLFAVVSYVYFGWLGIFIVFIIIIINWVSREKNLNELKIQNEELVFSNVRNIKYQRKSFTFSLKQIEQIDLVQTHIGRAAHKYIVIHTSKESTKMFVNFRYYQLVKIQEYFQNSLDIKTILVG